MRGRDRQEGETRRGGDCENSRQQTLLPLALAPSPTLRSMPISVKTAIVGSNSTHLHGRIDRLVQELCGLSRAQVRGLFDHGCVTLNGHLSTQPEERLKEGDRVELKYDPKLRYHERNK